VITQIKILNYGKWIKVSKFTYTTHEVANIVGVTKKTLLNWLKSNKIPEPVRDEKNNYRIWTAKDIAFIQNIKPGLSKESGR
jgi:excisionase family DNA binding protein